MDFLNNPVTDAAKLLPGKANPVQQPANFLFPGKKRLAGKPGEAPHEKQPQSPVSYALGATAPDTAEKAAWIDAEGKPHDENVGGFAGDIAEWLIYDRALNNADRMKVEDYLYQRYFVK